MNLLRSILFIGMLLSCSQYLTAQNSVDQYIDKYKNNNGVWAVTFPKWIVRKGFDFSDAFDDEDEQYAYQALAPYIKEVRVLAATEHAVKPLEGTISSLSKNMLKDKNNELYATARDGNQNIHVIIASEDRIIKKISLLLQSEEEIVVVRIEADLPEDFLSDPRFRFNQ